jgi:hypothetical protein
MTEQAASGAWKSAARPAHGLCVIRGCDCCRVVVYSLAAAWHVNNDALGHLPACFPRRCGRQRLLLQLLPVGTLT